jgi:hypothetical protein
VYPNVAQSPAVKHTWDASFTLQPPEMRSSGDSPGSGDAPPDGFLWSFRLITPAGVGSNTFAKHANYKGMDGKDPERRGNRYAIWQFRTDGGEQICEGFLTGDV